MKLAATIARDAIGTTGAGLAVLGVHAIYPPAAAILAGTMLVIVAVMLARRG